MGIKLRGTVLKPVESFGRDIARMTIASPCANEDKLYTCKAYILPWISAP